MTHGVDASFLVALELDEHVDHDSAKDTLSRLVAAGDRFAIAPQVLAEFIHVVTDVRRFTRPVQMTTAIQLAEKWWNAAEVDQVFTDSPATSRLFDWLRRYSLGRKRILDTLLATTLQQFGVTSILTTNPADFAVFGAFTCITPTRATSP
jgi:predicted nucleic acid-binding protein